MKKVLGVVLVILLFLPTLVIQPMASDALEFLQNGGFETANPAPLGWNLSGTFGTGYTIDTNNPYQGTNSLKMESGSGIYAYQSLEGFVGGDTYTLTFAVRAQEYRGTSLEVKFEFYTVDMYGKRISIGEQALTPAPQKNNQWEVFTYSVIMPQNVYFANVLFRLPKSGTIWYDALSLTGRQTDEPSSGIRAEDLPVYPYVEMPAGSQELVLTGSMEDKTGWSIAEKNASMVQYVSSPVRSGSTAIKIATKIEETTPYCHYTIKNGLQENALYQVSVYMRAPMLRGKGFGLKYEFLADGKGMGSTVDFESGRTRCVTDTNWMRFVQTFRVPKGADGVRLLFRVFGTGTVYIDDASCYKIEDAYVFDMETDEIFYYADRKEANVKLSLNPDKAAAMAGQTATCTLSGEGVSKTVTKVVSGETVSIAMPLAGLSKETPYTVTTTLAGTTKTETIYVYDRPTCLDAEGNYKLDDGTIYNPIFAYHINTADYKKAKEAGINLVQGSPKQATLDAAQEAGVMMLAVLYNDGLPAGHPSNAEKTRQTVETFKDHPGIYAWCIMDEPYSNNPGIFSELAESYKMIRAIDKKHPIFLMHDRDGFWEMSKCADILGIDPYPKGVNVLNSTYERCKKATATGKPVYCLQQVFDYGGWAPSSQEIVNMNMQAILGGAKAVGYYEWNISKGGVPLYNTDIWDSIVDWNLRTAPVLFEGMVCGTAVGETMETENVRYATFTNKDKSYLLFQNRTDAVQAVEIPLTANNKIRLGIEGKFIDNLSLLTEREGFSFSLGGNEPTINLPASDAVLCELTYCPSPKIGDVISVKFPEGEGTGFLAAYKGKELLKIAAEGETLAVDKNVDRIKAFYWCALQPLCDSVSRNIED